MRERPVFRLGSLAVAAAVVLAAPLARGQTAIWVGGGSNQNYTNPGNWSGGTVPPNTGADLMELPFSSGTVDITVNTAANVSGVQFDGTGFSSYTFNQDSAMNGSLTIGAGGIFPQSGAAPIMYVFVPIILSANQTWISAAPGYTAFIYSGVGISQSGGARTLTIGDGQVYMTGTNTFSGGTIVLSNGDLLAGTNSAAGTGTLTLNDGATLQSFTNTLNMANAVTLGNNVNLGSSGQPGNVLDLSGTITAQNAATSINLFNNSVSLFSGLLTATGPTDVTVGGTGAFLPADGGAQLRISGTTSQITSLTASQTSLILDPQTATPLNSYPGLSSGFGVTNGGYLGLDGTFDNGTGIGQFLTAYGATLGANIYGTLGFDNYDSAGVITEPIDLSAFSSTNFLGLGTTSNVTLAATAVITPTPNGYFFGGGGGTMTVASDLADGGSPTYLTMSAAASPLTVVLQGNNTYTGGTVSYGGVLVFDSAPPTTGQITLSGGYVGYTENAGLASPQQFVNLVNTGVATGVIGFDSSDPVGNPQTILGNIDLGAFSPESTPFLGTSTVMTLSGSINPANNSYNFTGVKGGNLTVTSDLNFGGAFLVVGLPTPIENNGSVSTVTLEGDNSGVSSATFNSGFLFINSDTALGIGAVAVPDPAAVLASPTLSPFGGTVTLANDISFGTVNPNSNPLPGLIVGNASTSDLLVLNGVLSDYDVAQPGGVGYLGITGSVALNNANTYTGGTIFTGSGNGIAYVGNSAAFGTGMITVQQPGVITPNTSGVSLANAINLESTLTLGSNGNPNLLTLTGDITGYSGLEILSDVSLTGTNDYTGSTFVQNANLAIGSSTALGTGPLQLSGATLSYSFTNPTVLDLSGDSGSTLTLAPSSTLTLDTDNNQGPEISFAGTINGDASTSVVKVDVGTELLTGTSPYGGGTSVNAGTLIAGSPGALGTGPVSVASGANLGVDSGTTLTLPISLSGGATLSGRGTFAPASPFTFAGGTTVVAGNALNGQYISTLTLGNSVTFGISGIYGFNVADAMGSAGTGYSTLAITGPLTISATPGLPFSIQLTSVDPSSGNPGLAMNFNSATPYTWTLLTASSISGFAANDFSVNTVHFQNSFVPGFFQVGQSGNTLTLDFTPVPEPSTWMLLGTGLAAVGAAFRRRKRG